MSDIPDTLFRLCVALFWMQKKGFLSDLRDEPIEHMRVLLKEHMILKAVGLSSRRADMTVSDVYPGYLEYKSGDIPIFFPWIIIEDLPDTEVIEELSFLCKQLIVGKFSTICLSGSSLYFGTLQSISDIDFLEYHPEPDTDNPFLAVPKGFFLLSKKENYFEFVTNSRFYGVIEVTNKIVKINYYERGDLASIDSSPFQEAPLVHTPRDLYDPFSIGRYINFLADKTLSFMHNHPDKAAKRLLPLSRILEKKNISDSISHAFNSSEVQSALKIKQKIELISKYTANGIIDESLLRLIRNNIDECRGNFSGVYQLSEVEKSCISSLFGAISHICLVNKQYLNGWASPI